MNDRWLKWAQDRGYRVAFGNLGLIELVRGLIEKQKLGGEIHNGFFENWLRGFKYLQECRLKKPTALVLLALPRPAHRLAFQRKKEKFEALIPPTYVDYRSTFEQVRRDAVQALCDESYGIELIDAPLKALAVLAGLARYGRNNLAYVPDMGSYVQLVGFVTDMPLECGLLPFAAAITTGLMDQCDECRACLNACPTGAIESQRTLLRAEKCYTILSETAGELPPEVPPPSPDCLIGCLKCQEVCPVNRGRLRYEQAPFSLTEKETTFLLSDPDEQMPQWVKIKEKFDQLHLTENTSLFVRNFRRMVDLGALKSRGRAQHKEKTR